MNFKHIFFKLALVLVLGLFGKANAQDIKWAKDGNSYYEVSQGEIVSISLPLNERKTIVSRNLLYSSGNTGLGEIKSFEISEDGTKVLLYTNSKKVWRYETRGDYFVADLKTNQLTQVGKDKPA